MLGLKLNHVSKRGHWYHSCFQIKYGQGCVVFSFDLISHHCIIYSLSYIYCFISSHWSLVNHLLSLNCHWGNPWWCHQMETFSALLILCVGNSPVTSEFPSQRPVTRSFGIFFDLLLNKCLSKQSWGWWMRCHCAHYDVIVMHNACEVTLKDMGNN